MLFDLKEIAKKLPKDLTENSTKGGVLRSKKLDELRLILRGQSKEVYYAPWTKEYHDVNGMLLALLELNKQFTQSSTRIGAS